MTVSSGRTSRIRRLGVRGGVRATVLAKAQSDIESTLSAQTSQARPEIEITRWLSNTVAASSSSVPASSAPTSVVPPAGGSSPTTISSPGTVNCAGGYSDRSSFPLRPCSKGFLVVQVQEFLNNLGYYVVIDGYYGQETADVVAEFQMDCGLSATGVVDAETWSLIAAG